VSLFSVDGPDARAVEQELRDVHRVHVKYREVRHLSGMRVSPHIYMRESELGRFVDALAEVVDKQSAGRS
jgi:selenocysteine lyase/cysteine desulfurase